MCGTDRAFRAAAQRFRKIQIPLQGSLSDWLQQKRNPQDDLKQLAGYYLCPACVSLAISGLVCVYVGGKFDFYTGVRAAPATYFLISSVLFFGIYLVYFIITYIGFCRNVEEWG